MQGDTRKPDWPIWRQWAEDGCRMTAFVAQAFNGRDVAQKANAAFIAAARTDLPRAVAEIRRLAKELEAAKRYPTEWAYERACEARTKWQERAEKAEAERDAMEHTISEEVAELQAERNTLRARVEELEGYLEDQQAMPDDSWRKEKASPS